MTQRGLTKDEKRSTLGSFLDTEETNLEVVDRSTLERWATCPWAAKAIEDGRCKTVGLAAEAGEAIHQALANVTRTWVESDIDVSPYEARDMLRGDLEQELRSARPDLQPEALAGMMPSAWAWSKFLSNINPGNILGFDGGDDIGRSSQFAYDFHDLGTRVTSELDLIYANPQTVELVEWTDYKTGHATHDIYDVAKSFQFQLHALLILERFKEVSAARLKVWDTRTNHQTYAVEFPRSRLPDYLWRVRSAVEVRRRHFDNPPTWPKTEGCRICAAAAMCPVAGDEIKQDDEGLLRQLVATGARYDALVEIAKARADARGKDIECGPLRFGRNKPKAARKPDAELYDLTPKGKQ